MPLLWVTGGRADQGRTRHSTVGHRPRVRGEIPPPAIPRGSAPPPGDRRAVSGYTPVETRYSIHWKSAPPLGASLETPGSKPLPLLGHFLGYTHCIPVSIEKSW